MVVVGWCGRRGVIELGTGNVVVPYNLVVLWEGGWMGLVSV